jgi:hypothetical protein
MSDFLNILDRFTIHLFAAYGLVVGVSFALRTVARKKPDWWFMPHDRRLILTFSALIVCLFAFAREPHDVDAGGWVVKSYFDFASWVIGSGCAVWGQYRAESWK